MYIACQKGHKDIVEYLLRRGANPNAKFKNKFTPLSIATQHNFHSIVALLREYGAQLSLTDEKAELSGYYTDKRNRNIDRYDYESDSDSETLELDLLMQQNPYQ